MVDIHDRLVTTLAALNRERPHAVLAHVGEVHGSIGSVKRAAAI
jgi:hypothetical protein